MVLLGFLRPVLSPIAGLIAAIAVFFDLIAHQLPIPGAIITEPAGYYILKFIVFYVAAFAVIKLGFLEKPYGPFLVGLFGATLFGVAYGYVEFAPLYQRAPGTRFLWGTIHFIFGVVAASLVLRRFGKALFAVVFIAVIILALIGFVV